jgi:hypothetical protein
VTGALLSYDDLKARIDALEALICESAPLTWAATRDLEAAQNWEKRAHELLSHFTRADLNGPHA